MNTTYAFAFAVAAALVVTACGKTETSTGPIAASTVESPVPHQPIAPPATKPAEVTLPPLPSDITAPAEPGALSGTARDTPANQPKGDLTPEDEKNAMPKAAQGNNHSSPSLESTPARPQ